MKEVKILERRRRRPRAAGRVPRRRARQEHPLRARVRLLRGARARSRGSSSKATCCAASTARYRFEPEGPASTRVHYDLAVELAVPLPGPRQAPRRRPDHGQRAQRAEEAGRSRRLTSARTELGLRPGRPASLARPMRILLFTGKGGVGKTTVAAATAVARRRARACARSSCSTDPAHSLADAFDVAAR